MTAPSDRTRLISAATRRGDGRRPVSPPVERASTMLSDTLGSMRDATLGPLYGLDGGSAAQALRQAITDLERADQAWILPSGLAAVTVPLLALLKPGDEVIATDAVYGPSRRFLTRWMGARGVMTRFHPVEATADEIIGMIGERTRVILIESPASITMEMIDVAAVAQAARARDVWTVMDNTWAAGLSFKPLQHGVDISVQAVTKYVSGHSDVLMGSVATSDAALARLIDATIEDMGWHVSPDDAWLALRGIRTLTLRYAEQARSGLEVATWLQAQPQVASVLYPPLPGCSGHDLWTRDYSGAASILSLAMKGGDEASAAAFLDALGLFGLGWSWGGFESLATHESWQITQRSHPHKVEGELIRLHIGLEAPADLIGDLEIGLAAWTRALEAAAI